MCVEAYDLRMQSMYEKNVARITRQADKYIFDIKHINTDLYSRSPYCVGALFWNELPKHIQDKDTKTTFKKTISDML